MKYEFYTDGAATMKRVNGEYRRGAGGWAWALIKDDEVFCEDYDCATGTTNNRMELLAIFGALNAYYCFFKTDKPDTIYINSDSAYCVNIYTQWAKGWEANGWTRGKKKEPIENVDLIKETWELIKKINTGFTTIEFVKVKGHAGNKWNDYVDKLAVESKTNLTGKMDKDFCNFIRPVY